MTIDDMLRRLRSVKPDMPRDLPESIRHASVLCLLYPVPAAAALTTTTTTTKAEVDDGDGDDPDDLAVLLTLRSATMRSHAGDVSFPGGRNDPEDGASSWRAALREAHEEVGLPYALSAPGGPLERLCTLPPYLSKDDLLVTPCVAHLPADPRALGWVPRRSVDEVAEIFSVRLAEIRDGVGYEGRWMTWYALRWRMHQFSLAGLPSPESSREPKRVWGLTARMLVDVARTAFGTPPPYDFVDELGDRSRIARAIADGTFGKQGRRERERAETTGEGQLARETPRQQQQQQSSAETGREDAAGAPRGHERRRKVARRGVL